MISFIRNLVNRLVIDNPKENRAAENSSGSGIAKRSGSGIAKSGYS